MKLSPERRFNALFGVFCSPGTSSIWSFIGCFFLFILSSLLHPIRMRGYFEDNRIAVHSDEKIRVRVEVASLVEKLILAGYSVLALLIPVNLGDRAYSTNVVNNLVQDLPFYGYALLFLAPCILGSIFIAIRVKSISKNLEDADSGKFFKMYFMEFVRSYTPFMLWFLAFGAVLFLMDGVATWGGMAVFRNNILEGVDPRRNSPNFMTDFTQHFIQGFVENLTRIVLVPFAIISYGFSVSVFSIKSGQVKDGAN